MYLTGPTLGATHIGSSTATVTGTTEQYGTFGRLTYQLVQGENYSLHIGGDAQAVFRPPTNTTTGVPSLTLSDRPELRIDPTAIVTTGAIAVGSIRNSGRSLSVSVGTPVVVFVGGLNTACASPPMWRE